jgi:hypothetical protein
MTPIETIHLMHERSKLTEARHFLDRMQVEHGNPAAFALELSAFIAAGRSVLQYACREARLKPGGQQWYDQTMANPLLCFFRDLRNNSIHEVSVKPVSKMTTEVTGFLNIGDDDEIMIPYPHNRTVQHYEFQDRPGEEVTDLSQRYLDVLEGVVEDGVAGGWITG